MIELKNNELTFTFPDVHPDAQLTLTFQRTLRIPDDDDTYALPPGLGTFPLKHVDDFRSKIPPSWNEHGGVMMPMFQAEAMWIDFSSEDIDNRGEYCFIVKIATGKVNAVTGEDWRDSVNRAPQDYLVVPTQPWLDGYCVEKGTIRQFVAMPLGAGYTAEEQVTGEARVGGVQIVVYPMKRKVFERRFPVRRRRRWSEDVCYSMSVDARFKEETVHMDMGLAPGGKMRQEIYDDPYDLADWDLRHRSRCFVHLANSMTWRAVTGTEPPTKPPTAKEYSDGGLPWFDYYAETPAVDGGGALGKSLKSLAEVSAEKGEALFSEEKSVVPAVVRGVGPAQRSGGRVREW
ncbi:MAG: hypothetical protein ABGZ17_08090 [Planctomycetaceae bacterium]